MTMTRGAFTYVPLVGGCIRLLKLHSDKQDSDRPFCSLEHIPLALADEQRYTALSYTWGTPDKSRTIECEGASLSINENLYEALQRLQSSNHRYLWIDQICINQADVQERNHQVQLMSKIYSSAETVLIWLGGNEGPEDKHHQHTRRIKGTSLVGNNNTAESHLVYNSYLPYLSNSYWSRLWVIQEVLPSKQTSILLDEEEIGWDSFWGRILNEISRLPGFPDQLDPDLQRALQFYSLTTSSSAIKLLIKDPTLVNLDPSLSPLAWAEFCRLTKFAKRLHSSDTRDMIYSWLGVITALGIDIPPPDYAISTAEVFQEARVALLKGHFSSVTGSTEEEVILIKQRGLPPLPKAGIQKACDSYLDRSTSRALPVWGRPLLIEGQDGLGTSAGLRALFGGLLAPIVGAVIRNKTDEDSISETGSDSQVEADLQIACRKHLEHVLTEQQQLLLDYVMTQLSKSLFDGTSHESRGEQHSPSATDPPEHQHAYKGGKQCKQTSQKQQGGSVNASGPSRKRLSLEDEERDDDDLKEPPRKQLKDHKADKPCKSLACPYHQRNSQNLQLNSSCRGPGFPDVARLKYVIHFRDRNVKD